MNNRFPFTAQIARYRRAYTPFVAVSSVLVTARLLGDFIGLSDFIWSTYLVLAPFAGLGWMLSGVVFLVWGIPSVKVLRGRQQRVLAQLGPAPRWLAVLMAFSAPLLLVYGVLHGRVMGEYFLEMATHPERLMGVHFLTDLGAVLSRGAWLEAARMSAGLDAAGRTHSLALGGLGAYALWALRTPARVGAGRQPGWSRPLLRDGPAQAACALALAGPFLALALPVPLAQQAGIVDFLQARDLQAAGDSLAAGGQFEAALEMYEQAAWFDPTLAESYAGMAFCSQQLGRTGQSISQALQALAVDPGLAGARAVLAENYYTLGVAYYQQNDLERAADALAEALTYEPENQMARLYLSLSYLYSGKPAEAEVQAHRLVARYPGWAGPLAVEALALSELNRPEQADLAAEKALAQGEKTPLDRSLILKALFAAGRFAEAEAEARAAIQAGPVEAELHLALAEALLKQGQFAQALEACNQAGRRGADPAAVLLQRARIYTAQERSGEAIALLEQARSITPERAEVHSRLSSLYYEQENYPAALNAAEQAVGLDPYLVDGYLVAAYAHLALGEPQAALQAARRAVELAPTSDTPHFVLGLCYAKTGSGSLVMQEMSRFLELYRDGPHKLEMKQQAEEVLASLRVTY